MRSLVLACAASAACVAAWAQPQAKPSNGSTAFCLLQVPAEDPGKQRWINLGMVQYVETSSNELRIVFGSGNVGSGYELRLVYGSPEEAAAQVERMRQAAAACTGR